ncbi:four-carbon acid sugar kinase family protein [Martelella limonii]|uniref:four-carbon acid sugar kinase family protein n=1 Tax=Martelella limonii TaxID=1647649 RepID=UPI003140AC28
MLADDLTGALDSSVAFAMAGRSVVLARRADALGDVLAQHPDVIALSSGSRECSAGEAARRVEAMLRPLPLKSFDLVIKKVDSRLKGNIDAEMTVLCKALDPPQVIAAPAIPSMGRTVESGRLTGSGVAQPIDVAARFAMPVHVPDVVVDADFDAAIAAAPAGALWVGARGLSFALARADAGGPAVPALPADMLIVNGSRDPITLAQIARIAERVSVLEAPDGLVDAAASPALPAVVTMTDGGGGLDGATAAARFGRSIGALVRRLKPSMLLIAGGESANAILDDLGIVTLQVLSELRPGLPVSLASGPWQTLQIVTKSGGFGSPELLEELYDEALRSGGAFEEA